MAEQEVDVTDEVDAVQVVMLPDLFDRFREWLDREHNGETFQIPNSADDLPTHCVRFRRT